MKTTLIAVILSANSAYAVNGEEADEIIKQGIRGEAPTITVHPETKSHRVGDSCRSATDCGSRMVCAIGHNRDEGVCVAKDAKIHR